jgi:phospholipase/carboxylesterase
MSMTHNQQSKFLSKLCCQLLALLLSHSLVYGDEAVADSAPNQPQTARTTVLLGSGAIASIPLTLGNSNAHPPLIILLHGAGQKPEDMIVHFATDPGFARTVFLAPKSSGPTWDVIARANQNAFSGAGTRFRYTGSPDGERVLSAITQLNHKIETDPSQQILLGFSDGASFALSLGTGRDQSFCGVVALSPGIVLMSGRLARDRTVLIMHGTQDRTLPFEFTRQSIVPELRRAGLSVNLVSFSGGHEIAVTTQVSITHAFPATAFD